MGSITNIELSSLSTYYSKQCSVVNKSLQHREKIFGNAENQTQGSWVRTPNDTTVLAPPP